jgi:hypothetical protein
MVAVISTVILMGAGTPLPTSAICKAIQRMSIAVTIYFNGMLREREDARPYRSGLAWFAGVR